jgi:putative transposase
MPWKELCTMSIREEFVINAKEPGVKLAALCREYGVSRKTGYKWMKRYDYGGVRALEDMSRRPQESPLRVSGDVVAEVVNLRVLHRAWGAKKLAEILRRRLGDQSPSTRTVARILVRSGLIQRARRRPCKLAMPFGPPKVSVKAPNDLWSVDFKGWWLTTSRERCEPLTVRDAHSRFILAVDVMVSTEGGSVETAFQRLFKTYGLPKAILTDGGPPFVAPNISMGLTKLNVWWLSLGIEHYRARPATPSDNGGHERMHRNIAEELEVFSALNRRAQQDACDRWRHEFNEHRPHESLGMRMPSEIYRRSDVLYEDKPVDVTYPENFLVRRASSNGEVKWLQRNLFLSTALTGQAVGLEPLKGRHFNVWFAHRLLGIADYSKEKAVFSPTPWNRQGDEEQESAITQERRSAG